MLVRPANRVPGIRLQTSPRGILSAADLILPDHHAESIAVIVVSPRFDLDVFADHVEAGRLQPLDVEQHRFVRRRSQQSIRPPTLIERPPMKDRLAIEREPPVPVGVLYLADRANAGVRLDLIDRVAIGIDQCDFQIVQMGDDGDQSFALGMLSVIAPAAPFDSATIASPSRATILTCDRVAHECWLDGDRARLRHRSRSSGP